MNPLTMWRAGWGAGLLVLLSASCATPKQLQAYQDEIVALREERTQLKKENRGLRMQLESYEVALAEANSMVADEPATQSYAELDDLGIGYGQRGNDFVISVPAEVTFASGKADVTRNGRGALDAVARTLQKDYANSFFWIEGHTDSDPIKKSSWNSNRELSVARAMAVLHYLVEDAGLEDEQCIVVGHGEYRPMAENNNKAGKAKNRRVEIVVRGG